MGLSAAESAAFAAAIDGTVGGERMLAVRVHLDALPEPLAWHSELA